MELFKLMEFAKAYARLGWAIQEQLDDIVDGDYDDLNPSAVAEIAAKLKGHNEDLDASINEALAATAAAQE